MRLFNDSKEAHIAKRLREGDADALRDFYVLYADYLTGVCSRYVADDDDLKDVLQDALVNIISHIKDFEYKGAGTLRAWSARIVVNESLKYLQQRYHHKFERLDSIGTIVEEEEDPTVADIPPERFAQMIRDLPPGYRTIFNLYVFEEKSHQEIADLLGIRETTSCSQFSRAKNLLAKKIREYQQQNDINDEGTD